MTSSFWGLGQRTRLWPAFLYRLDRSQEELTGFGGGDHHKPLQPKNKVRGIEFLHRGLSEQQHLPENGQDFGWCVNVAGAPAVTVCPSYCLAKGPPALFPPCQVGRQVASRLTNQLAHHLGVINDSMLPFCQNGFSGERYSLFPCITVCDTIDLISTLSCLSGLHSNRWLGRHHFPQSVSGRKCASCLLKNSSIKANFWRLFLKARWPSRWSCLVWQGREIGDHGERTEQKW